MAVTITNLYRAVLRDELPGSLVDAGVPAVGVLYPTLVDTPYVDGAGVNRVRPPDVTYDEGEILPGGGTSLFDRRGVFGNKRWQYFDIPEGTDIPASLVVTKESEFNKKFKAFHYQIEPKARISVDGLKGALDNFARNAVVRAIELVLVK